MEEEEDQLERKPVGTTVDAPHPQWQSDYEATVANLISAESDC
jgi:hypothetical protein